METVITKVDPKSAILVSDGAEDEFIYPILASRIQIDGIKRVVVKQSRNIESIYYMFARSMQDDRVRKKFVLPLALALIVFSTFFILTSIANSIYPDAKIPDISWAVVFLTLGVYIIVKAYKLDEPIKAMSTDAKTAITTIPFLMLAGITIIAGILAGWSAVHNEPDQVAQILTLLGILLWTGVFAIILLGLGRAMQVYSKENDFPWVFFPMVLSILAFSSFMQMAIFIVSFWMNISDAGVMDDIAAFFGLGVVFLLLGYILFSGMKEQKRNADWHQ
jgi:putative membrane protein